MQLQLWPNHLFRPLTNTPLTNTLTQVPVHSFQPIHTKMKNTELSSHTKIACILTAPLSKVAAYTPTSNILAVPAVKTVAYPRITPGYLPPAQIAPVYKGSLNANHKNSSATWSVDWWCERLLFLHGSLVSFAAPAYAVTPAPYVSTYVSAPKAVYTPQVVCDILRSGAAETSNSYVHVNRMHKCESQFFYLFIESRVSIACLWLVGLWLDLFEQCDPFDSRTSLWCM